MNFIISEGSGITVVFRTCQDRNLPRLELAIVHRGLGHSAEGSRKIRGPLELHIEEYCIICSSGGSRKIRGPLELHIEEY